MGIPYKRAYALSSYALTYVALKAVRTPDDEGAQPQGRGEGVLGGADPCVTANLPTNITDFGGFDSSIILMLRGGIPRPVGNLPESLSQAMLVGIMLVGRLGVEGRSAAECIVCMQ